MSGELPSDPYCARKLREENAAKDEEAFFEVWFQMQRRKHFESLYPGDPFREGWGMGYRSAMLEGWLGRANFRVSYARNPGAAK